MRFDLQMFAANAAATHTMHDVLIDEMTIVTKIGPDGKPWAPRNPGALVLGIKGGPVKTAGGKTVKVADGAPAFVPVTLKAGIDDATHVLYLSKGWLIPDDILVEDKIDGDGDGGEDYSQIAGLIMSTNYDLSSASGISNDTARVAAVVATIDACLANLDDIRSGGEGRVVKAGRKHSADTMTKLEAMRKKHGEMGAQIDDLMGEPKADDKAKKAGEVDVAPVVLETGATSASSIAAIKESFAAPAVILQGADARANGVALTKASMQGDTVTVAHTPAAASVPVAPAEAVKGAVVTPDPAIAELRTLIETQKASADATIATLQSSLDDVTRKAAASDSLLSTITRDALKPTATGGIATTREDGSVATAAATGGGGVAMKGGAMPDISMMDTVSAAIALQRAARGEPT